MTQTMERPPVGCTAAARARNAKAQRCDWLRSLDPQAHAGARYRSIAALADRRSDGLLINMSFRQGTPARPYGIRPRQLPTGLRLALTYSTLLNTVIYAGAVSVVSLRLATIFAWLVERTDMPGRNLVWVAMLIPLAMPGMLSAMSWILLGSPKIGALNVWIRNLLDLVGIHMDSGPFNIYSLYGMILVESLKGTSTLFLLIVGAFRLMDPALEDASTMSGGLRWKTLRYVTLPLMKPALLAAGIFAFLGNMEDFDTPLLLGLPANVFILPTLIYFTAYVSPSSS